jgi:hypothetical protein
MRIIFETFEKFNAAKALELTTITIGSPIFETDAEGLLTGRYIVDHQFTAEQLEELSDYGIVPEQGESE